MTILVWEKRVSENKTVRNVYASEVFTVQYKTFNSSEAACFQVYGANSGRGTA